MTLQKAINATRLVQQYTKTRFKHLFQGKCFILLFTSDKQWNHLLKCNNILDTTITVVFACVWTSKKPY